MGTKLWHRKRRHRNRGDKGTGDGRECLGNGNTDEERGGKSEGGKLGPVLGAVKEGTVNRHMLLLLSPSYGPPEVYLPGRSSKTIMEAAKDEDDDVLVRGRITSATMASRVIQLEGRTDCGIRRRKRDSD